jgi:Flp pilus assembly CpaE family ATPase
LTAKSFGDVAAMLDLRADRSIIEFIRDIDKIDRANVTEYLVRHPSGLCAAGAARESAVEGGGARVIPQGR